MCLDHIVDISGAMHHDEQQHDIYLNSNDKIKEFKSDVKITILDVIQQLFSKLVLKYVH